MKKKLKKYLKVTGIVFGIIAVLAAALVIAVKFTPVGNYITPDLLSLIGMLLVTLLMLAVLIAFIVMDFRKVKNGKRKSFSGIQNAKDIIFEAFQNINDK